MEITFHHVLPVFETLCVWASQQETLCTNNTHYTANTHMNLSDSLFLLKLKKQMKLKTSFLYFHVINYIIIQFKLKGTFKSEAMFLEFSQSGPISLHPPSHSHTTVCLSIHVCLHFRTHRVYLYTFSFIQELRSSNCRGGCSTWTTLSSLTEVKRCLRTCSPTLLWNNLTGLHHWWWLFASSSTRSTQFLPECENDPDTMTGRFFLDPLLPVTFMAAVNKLLS